MKGLCLPVAYKPEVLTERSILAERKAEAKIVAEKLADSLTNALAYEAVHR